jgi:hypothetical protein
LTVDESWTPEEKQSIYDLRWYALFLSREIKCLVIALVLYWAVSDVLLKRIALMFLVFQSFETVSEFLQVGHKGGNYEYMWMAIIGLILFTPLYGHIKKGYEKLVNRFSN